MVAAGLLGLSLGASTAVAQPPRPVDAPAATAAELNDRFEAVLADEESREPILPLAERVLAEIRARFPQDRVQVVRAMLNHAMAKRRQFLEDGHPFLLEVINSGADPGIDIARLQLAAAATLVEDIQYETARAEPLARQAMALARQYDLVAEEARFAGQLANIVESPARLGEAEAALLSALARTDARLGADSASSVALLERLARFYRDQQRPFAAEPFLVRLLDIQERRTGAQSAPYIATLRLLANARFGQGDQEGARELYAAAADHSAPIVDEGFDLEWPEMMLRAGRAAQALPVLEAWVRRIEGPGYGNSWEIMTAADALLDAYIATGDLASAERFARRLGPDLDGTDFEALAGHQVDGGKSSRSLFSTRLAEILLARGQPAEAVAIATRNLAETRRAVAMLSAENRQISGEASINKARLELARILCGASRWRECETVLGGAQETAPASSGYYFDSELAEASTLLIATSLDHGDGRRAVAASRMLRRQLARNATTASGAALTLPAPEADQEQLVRAANLSLADALWVSTAPAQRGAQTTEVFEALQAGTMSEGSRVMARRAARGGAGNDTLAQLATEREQLRDRWRGLSIQRNLAATSRADAEGRAAIVAELTRLETRLAQIDAELAQRFPSYFALAQPTNVSLPDFQSLIGPDALLMVVPTERGTHSLVITADGIAAWNRSSMTAAQVGESVDRLRWEVGARVDASPEVQERLAAEHPEGAAPIFDRRAAFRLYDELVRPVEQALAGRRRLYVVASGALASLPFSMLVTAAPTDGGTDPAQLRTTPWLADRWPLIHLPSVQTLVLLRRGQLPAASTQALFAVGNPALDGAPMERRGAARSAAPLGVRPAGSPPRRPRIATRGDTIAQVDDLRRLRQLPGTAVELEQVRQALGAPMSALLSGPAATEPAVRHANLTGTRTILFSTHGLTASEGVGEAGLVLSPPRVATQEDDGYLAASEVATMRLGADWVILSACNSATGDNVEDAGLGPLARAFFYAGARNLLASHWPVSDDVAPLLISTTLELERSGMARPEALQQAMQRVRAQSDQHPEWAHPLYWAPFVFIGDGGR